MCLTINQYFNDTHAGYAVKFSSSSPHHTDLQRGMEAVRYARLDALV
ncbi:hypothetical protein [Candidatus Erwinia haradaeae]|nr:hypothetical protein [Candidatus Erwinia haradaeae]